MAEQPAPPAVGAGDLWDGKIVTPQSGRTEAVETSGIICPLRITDMDRAVRDVHRLQQNPGAPKVGAGFHHDGNVCCPADIETELTRLHTEAAITRLCLRIP